jgi:hypothetical protein
MCNLLNASLNNLPKKKPLMKSTAQQKLIALSFNGDVVTEFKDVGGGLAVL